MSLGYYEDYREGNKKDHSIFCLYPPYGRHPCLKNNSMELPMDDTLTENKNPWKKPMDDMHYDFFHWNAYERH